MNDPLGKSNQNPYLRSQQQREKLTHIICSHQFAVPQKMLPIFLKSLLMLLQKV